MVGDAPNPGLAELLSRAAAARPEHPAVVEPGRPALTWAMLDAEVDRVAGGLVAAGVVAGTRVLLALGNRSELVTAYLAVLRAQAVAVPVDPAARDSELAALLVDSGSRYAVTDAGSAERVRGLAARPVRIVVVGEPSVPGDPAFGELAFGDLAFGELSGGGPLPSLLDDERLAALLYTSGTSGPPRGAMLTHRALAANVAQVAAVEPPLIAPDDVVLGVLPLFHVYGLGAVLGATVRQAATLVLAGSFDADDTLDLVATHGCTVLPLVPGALEAWLARPRLREALAGVRVVLSGSAPLNRSTARAFQDGSGVPVHQGYGLTEAAPVVTSTLVPGADGAPARLGSLGRSLPGGELRLVDERGEPVVPGDPGEIEIRGPHLFSGYWPDGTDGPRADGWWATGDLGVLDDAGCLGLVDRVRELISVAGFAVYPQEVEEVLRGVPEAAEVAVIGVPEGPGEIVVAYVVASDGADPERLAEELLAEAARRLAGFKRPARIEVVERLPLTVTGRVQKGRLRHLERRRGQGLLS